MGEQDEAKYVTWFVNRERQRRGFIKMLERETPRQIMFVEAPNGMGKTWLIGRLRHDCKVREVPVAHFDFWGAWPMDYLAMGRQARDQLGPAHFNATTQIINEATSITVKVDVESQRRGDVNISLGDVTDSEVTIGDVAGGSIVKDNFFEVRADSPEIRERTRARILDSFFECLLALSQKQVAVFLFDTYDEAQDEARQWVEGELLSKVRYEQLPNVLVVLAGQKTPHLDRSAWDQFLALTDLALFTPEDVQKYLERRGQTQLDLKTIIAVSGGHPAKLGEMVDTASVSSATDEEEDWI
jgi:GTPase SAR1 family protein